MFISSLLVAVALSQVSVPEQDPRIDRSEYTQEESAAIIAAFNEARGEDNACLFGFVNDYKRDVYNYCIANDLADGEKFGCERMMGYGLHEGVLEAGLKKCEVDLPESDTE
ncbi:hypothetical protein [Parvularcula sp. IMCC14364]|uniref:hypothetical protein n=1 Tax=Parvularcula sp. IMCC14364 TaxID=3067902 RepID=UPI0027407890|nr:hypothetical protein [Parvularcula sp. IMCC14364]